MASLAPRRIGVRGVILPAVANDKRVNSAAKHFWPRPLAEAGRRTRGFDGERVVLRGSPLPNVPVG